MPINNWIALVTRRPLLHWNQSLFGGVKELGLHSKRPLVGRSSPKETTERKRVRVLAKANAIKIAIWSVSHSNALGPPTREPSLAKSSRPDIWATSEMSMRPIMLEWILNYTPSRAAPQDDDTKHEEAREGFRRQDSLLGQFGNGRAYLALHITNWIINFRLPVSQIFTKTLSLGLVHERKKWLTNWLATHSVAHFEIS